MAEVVAFKLEIDGVEQSINSVADLKKAISDLQKAAENADLGSENQKQLVEQLDVLQGKMRQATTSQENLAKAAHEANLETNDLRKQFEKLENELFLMAGQGKQNTKEFRSLTIEAAALNKKIDAVNQSLGENSAGRASAGFSQLSDGLKNLDFDSVKKGLAVMKTALAATGVMLLVQGVMYLIENFDSLSKGSGILGQSLRAVGEVISWVKNAVTDLVGVTDDSTRALEKQGEAIKKSSDIATEKLTIQTAAYDRQIAAIKATGKSAIELEKAKQENIIKTNLELARQIEAYVRSGGVLDEEKRKQLSGNLEAIKAARATENLDIVNDHKDKLDKYKDNLQKHQDALKKKIEDQIKLEEDEKKRRESDLAIKVDLTPGSKEVADREIVLQELQGLEDKYNQINKEKKAAYNAEQFEKDLDETKNYLNAVSGLNDIFFLYQQGKRNKSAESEEKAARNQFKITKGVQLGMAIIDGYKSISASLAQAPVAIGGAPNPAGIASLAFAAISTAATIAKIAATQYQPSGGGGATAGAGVASPSIPNSSVPNVTPNTPQPTTLLDSNGQPINNNKPQVIKVINLVDDTTRVQNDLARVINQSTI